MFGFQKVLTVFASSIIFYGCANQNAATLHVFESEKRSTVRHMVYPLCRGDRVDELITPTREFMAGGYELPVYIMRWDARVDNSGYEAYFSLPLRLDSAKHYIFQTDFSTVNKDRVMVWVAEMETGVVVSEKVVVELQSPLPAREFSLRRLCKKSSDKAGLGAERP